MLYHGSFAGPRPASQPEFDWRAEAWETLTHELRHHLEWRARAPDLEAYDRAAEHNFARQDGEPFDPLFFLDGDPAGRRTLPGGRRRLPRRDGGRACPRSGACSGAAGCTGSRIPPDATLPAFLTVEGVAEPPEGELVLVLRRPPGCATCSGDRGLFQAAVRATEVYVSPDPTQIPQP